MSTSGTGRYEDDNLNRLGLEDELFLQSILAGNSTHQLQHFFQHQQQQQSLHGPQMHPPPTAQTHSPSLSDILPRSLSDFVSSSSPAPLQRPTLQIDALDPSLKRNRYSPTDPATSLLDPALSVQNNNPTHRNYRPAGFQPFHPQQPCQQQQTQQQQQPANSQLAPFHSDTMDTKDTNGHCLPEENEGMDEAASGRTRDSVLQRNRLAQRKFRVRQKERMKSTKEQLEAMTAEMDQLRMEKSQLETRTRILEQVVKLNTVHEARLHATSEIMSREQELLLEELASFVDLVDGKPVGTHRTADAKQWTMHEVMESIFPRYIDKLKTLLSQSGERESSPAYGELNHLVNTRREHEKRRALFSCYYWAVYSWNLHEMRAAQSPPTTAAWSIILNQLQLTETQELGLLRAQQHLTTRLQAVGKERSQILSAVGLELLQTNQGAWHLCSSVQQLQRNFGQEREAVFQFLFTFCDEMLTAQQEARLEAASFPWCPDFWEMTNLLAVKHKQAPPPLLLGLEVTGPALLPLLPLNTAFQFLVKPLMTRGLGMRLKRGIAIDPFETVVPASAFPIASMEQLRPMSLHDVHCGGYREQMFWTWAKSNLPNYIQIPC